jgi:gluconate 2-dehydrogenase gamma chain
MNWQRYLGVCTSIEACAAVTPRSKMHDTVRNLTRREWILGSLSATTLAAIASAQEHAHQAVAAGSTPVLEHFDAVTARDVVAITARIIPSDDGPGAAEAGAVYFIDRALKTFAADQQALYRDGLTDLKARREHSFPGTSSFADLTSTQQERLLQSIETTDFFAVVRQHTVLAWLGSPEYGGNRGGVGWKYIGFDDRGYFTPPFGFYDASVK